MFPCSTIFSLISNVLLISFINSSSFLQAVKKSMMVFCCSLDSSESSIVAYLAVFPYKHLNVGLLACGSSASTNNEINRCRLR